MKNCSRRLELLYRGIGVGDWPIGYFGGLAATALIGSKRTGLARELFEQARIFDPRVQYRYQLNP